MIINKIDLRRVTIINTKWRCSSLSDSGESLGLNPVGGGVWHDLVNLEWLDPHNSGHTPEAVLVPSDHTESVEGHCLWVEGSVVEDELVGWSPGHVLANPLPVVGVSEVGGGGSGSDEAAIGLGESSWLWNDSWVGSLDGLDNKLGEVGILLWLLLIDLNFGDIHWDLGLGDLGGRGNSGEGSKLEEFHLFFCFLFINYNFAPLRRLSTQNFLIPFVLNDQNCINQLFLNSRYVKLKRLKF